MTKDTTAGGVEAADIVYAIREMTGRLVDGEFVQQYALSFSEAEKLIAALTPPTTGDGAGVAVRCKTCGGQGHVYREGFMVVLDPCPDCTASLTPAPTQGDGGFKFDISEEWLERKAKQEGSADPTTGSPKVCPECEGKGEVLGKHTFGKGWEMATCPRCLGNGSTKHAELMALLDATPSAPVSAPSPAGERRPLKMLLDREQMRRVIEQSPDEDCDAGRLHPEASPAGGVREANARAVYEAMGFAYEGRGIGSRGPFGEWAVALKAADAIAALSSPATPEPALAGGTEPNFCESCAMDLAACDCANPRPVRVEYGGRPKDHATLVAECAPYLKDGETPRQRMDRDFADSQALSKLLAKERERTAAASDALAECEEYFDQLADADWDQDGFIPNKEMRLLSVVRAILSSLSPASGGAELATGEKEVG